MKKIIIAGSNKLEGEIHINGSKNSALPIICASLLSKGVVTLNNVPKIEDVNNLIEILQSLNVEVKSEKHSLVIDSSNLLNVPINHINVSKLRASYYLMGVYLALFNRVTIDMPGGCDFGSRPIDIHLKSFKRLNCDYQIDNNLVEIKTDFLKANNLFLDIPSVGATINVMLAAVLTEGMTLIENAAKEPEIVDVANFLNSMGAKISGAGSGVIRIEGVKNLQGTEHNIIYDRIEAGTYILAAAPNCREVDIINFDYRHNNALISCLIESNVKFRLAENQIKLLPSPDILPLDIKTNFFPGFPTDLQQIMTAFLTQAKGISTVQDNIYPNRTKNCYELNKMGASVIVRDNIIEIYGPKKLKGTSVEATDLRGGASLVLAALHAEGETTINNAYHIFRGYNNIVKNIKSIGGKIRVE